MRIWKLEGKKAGSRFPEGSWGWNPSWGFPCFLPTMAWPLAWSLPCISGSLSNCSPHVFTYISHRHLELHASRHPNFSCQTSSPRIFSILLNSTLYLSCHAGPKPQSYPCFLFFSQHPKYNPARSLQDPATSCHSHCHHPGPSRHHQCPDYCNSLLRGFPVPTFTPLPRLFSTEQPKDPFTIGHHLTKPYDPYKGPYFLSRYFYSHPHLSSFSPCWSSHWPSRCLIPGLCILLLSRILFLQMPSWSSSIMKAIDPKCRTFIPLESRRLSHIGAWKRASSWVSLLASGQGTSVLSQLTG